MLWREPDATASIRAAVSLHEGPQTCLDLDVVHRMTLTNVQVFGSKTVVDAHVHLEVSLLLQKALIF